MKENNLREDLKPLVSVCIPVFNGADMISRAIESCLQQTYSNIELIIVDDASTDGTKEIVTYYAAHDKRVKYFRNQRTLGFINNYFNSFQFSSGEYFQHLGHDDWLSRNYIEEGVKNFNLYPGTLCVLGRVISIRSENGDNFYFNNETLFDSKSYSIDSVLKNFLKDDWGMGFLSLFKRECVDILALRSLFSEISKDPDYGYLYKKGVASDHFIFLKILEEHGFRSVIYTKKSSYLKLERPMSTGTFVHLDPGKRVESLKFNRALLTSYLYVCQGEFKRYQSLFKVHMGAIAINEFLNSKRDIFFRRISARISIEEEKIFFIDYSSWEKLSALLYALSFLFARIGKFLKRKIFSKREEPTLFFNENYFLDHNGRFKI